MVTTRLHGDTVLLRALVDAVPLPCAVTALHDGTVLAFNPQMAELLGITGTDLTNVAWAAPFYAEPNRRRELMARVRADGLVRDIEFAALRVDGTPVPCLASFHRVEWQGAAVVVVCLIDIADRKAAELALRASEEKFREIAENTSDVIWHLDLDLTITYVGGGVRLLTWLCRGDLLGRSAGEFFMPEHAAMLRAAREHRLGQERAGITTTVARYEAELLNHAGETLWVELHVYPHRDGTGALVGYFGVMRDISQRKRAESALRQSEHLFRQLFDADPVAKLLVDPETGVIVNANASAARFHGHPPAALNGHSLRDLVEPMCHDPACPLTTLHRTAECGGGPVEMTHILADGTRRLVAAHVGLVDVPGPGGTPRTHFHLSLFDVTDRQRYAAELEQRNTALRDFTTAVSHDLQEPLRLVTSYLGLLERRLDGRLDTDEREFIRYAVGGGARMRAMIQGLLTYARLDTRARAAEPVALDAVVATVQDTLRAALTEAGATLSVPAPLPRVLGDREQLVSLVQNLIANAIRYRHPDRPCHITVVWRHGGGHAEVGIGDTGIGIDPKHHDRIFGVFQRLRQIDDETGTGMGLAICRRIVARHGGDIWVDSEPRQGATFWFTLRLADPRGDSGTA
ncbi:PAS domain S-box protein [Roseospira goensis]|uniref:histidine kinase n=1 Tax=Roseospira goensis TaxID=391922 RepID=A0A7W6WL57_9PROT|nr:PAS domain S-box protein [Roseospira goensis]MBB4287071.1 PAS domain S-box-containing protein [Roseospira goensis]